MTKRWACGLAVWMLTVSCGGAPEAAPRTDSATETEAEQGLELTLLSEVTVEGEAAVASDALANAHVTLAPPFLEVKALTVRNDDGFETNLVVRTEAGWSTVHDPLLVSWDDDPGCPSIERETAITEVRVELGALVVVTTSDRGWQSDTRYGSLELTKARACRLVEGDVACGDPQTVAASLSSRAADDDAPDMPEAAQTFSTRYWVDADGEIEVAETFDGETAFPE